MEIDEIVKLLEQREQRVDELRSRLAAVMEAEKELTRELSVALTSPPSKSDRARSRFTAKEVTDRSYEILRTAESHELPMQVAEIWSRLEAQGVYVGGKKPTGNLSAMLGRDDRFQTEGRGGKGWSLAGETQNAPLDLHQVNSGDLPLPPVRATAPNSFNVG